MFVSFGSASGGIEAFDLGLLVRKGSLFATRPTLGTYCPTGRGSRRWRASSSARSGTATSPSTSAGRLPLAEAAEAHRALEARETTGSLILLP